MHKNLVKVYVTEEMRKQGNESCFQMAVLSAVELYHYVGYYLYIINMVFNMAGINIQAKVKKGLARAA